MKPYLPFLLILAAIALSYHNIFANEFVGDDPSFILYWDAIKDWQHLPQLLQGTLAEGHEGIYRPLRSVLYVIVYSLAGEQPVGYHIFSLIIHSLASFLVFGLTKCLSHSKALALASALLFAAHPIHTEAITFMASSFDVAGIVFMLAAVWQYLKLKPKSYFIQSKYWLSLLLATLAFFTNEIALCLPILLTWYELTLGVYRGQPLNDRRKWLELGGKIAPYLVIAGLYLWVRMGLLGIISRGTYQADSFYLTVLVTLKVWMQYFQLLLLPYNLSLNHILPSGIHTYSVEEVNQGAILNQHLWDPSVLVALLILGGLGYIVLKLRATQGLFVFALGWIAISLLPVSNLIPNTCLLCERYTYLASVGYCLGLAWLGHGLALRYKSQGQPSHWLATISLIGIVGGYSWLTGQRNLAWRSEITLWEITAQTSPNATVYYKLGSAYQTQDRFEEATQAYQLALAITPEFAQVYHNLAVIAYDQGQSAQAKKYHQQALELKQDLWQSQAKLGQLYVEEKNYQTALEHFQLAYAYHPVEAIAQDLVTTIYAYVPTLIAQHPDQARKLLLQALDYDQHSARSLYNLGTFYAQQAQYDQAIAYYKQALQADPEFEPAQVNLDRVYQLKEDAP